MGSEVAKYEIRTSALAWRRAAARRAFKRVSALPLSPSSRSARACQ